MFQFTVSTGIVHRAFARLSWKERLAARILFWAQGGASLDELAPHWGNHVVGGIAIMAYRVQHGCYELNVPKQLSPAFCVIKDGKFEPKLAEWLADTLHFVGAQDPLLDEIARELLDHFRARGMPALHPQAAISRLVMDGETVLAFVRPQIPQARSSNWKPARVLK